MAKKGKVIMVFDEDTGGVEMEGSGFTGKACQGLLNFLSKLVGKETNREKKPEFYLKEKKKETLKH